MSPQNGPEWKENWNMDLITSTINLLQAIHLMIYILKSNWELFWVEEQKLERSYKEIEEQNKDF